MTKPTQAQIEAAKKEYINRCGYYRLPSDETFAAILTAVAVSPTQAQIEAAASAMRGLIDDEKHPVDWLIYAKAALTAAAEVMEHKCTICSDITDLACSDCRIDFQTTIYVCKKSSCRDEHEEKCPAKMEWHRRKAVAATIERCTQKLEELLKCHINRIGNHLAQTLVDAIRMMK